MRKRLISLILTACLFLCPGLSAAADSGGGAQSVELLQALGIGGITKDMEAVTREQFICAVSDILNYTARPRQMDGVFPDVTAKDASSGAIYDAVSRGLIAGYGDGSFGPDDLVLAEQAVKIIVRALGYGVLAEQQGGYPLGYLMTAQEKGILKGIPLTAGAGITGDAAAAMLENALNTEVLLQVGFGENSAFEARRGRTLLTEFLSLQKVTGIISDNGKTGLTGESKVGKKQVLLGGELYDVGGTGAAELLGYRVTAYVTDGRGIPEKVLYLRSDRTNTLKIAAERLAKEDGGFSMQNIVYEDVYGKTARAKVDAEADFILNGKADLDLRVEDLKISSGALLLIDNNGDLVYDVIMVQSARTIVVQSVSLNERTIYGKNGEEKLILEGKEKTAEIIKDGKVVSLEELEEWDVLTVYESRDKEELRLLASSEKLPGTVESFSADSGTIVIDGELYQRKDTLDMSFVTLGGSYEFCLDPDGSIAAVKAESAASSMVGFLIKAKREQGITNVLQLKLFTSGGEHVVYRCSDSLKLGGLKGAAAAEYLEKNAVGGLISYKLDSRGEVKEADLPYAGIPAPHQRPESLRLEHKATRELLYRNAQSAFEGIINMDGETVVFLIPDDLEDENGYDITSASYFMNNTRYAPDAYCMGIEDGRADFLVYTPKDKYTDQEGAVLVSKITRMVNQEGETTECLHGYKDSGEVTVLAKEDGMFTQAGVKEGDVIRYLTGKQGYATGVRKILDYASGRIVNDANLSYSNGFRVIKGNVYHKYGDLIGITSDAVTSEEVKQNLENQVVTGAKIYLFDPEKQNKISAVTADSICDYLHMPEEYSTVLVYTRNSACKMVVIYR